MESLIDFNLKSLWQAGYELNDDLDGYHIEGVSHGSLFSPDCLFAYRLFQGYSIRAGVPDSSDHWVGTFSANLSLFPFTLADESQYLAYAGQVSRGKIPGAYIELIFYAGPYQPYGVGTALLLRSASAGQAYFHRLTLPTAEQALMLNGNVLSSEDHMDDAWRIILTDSSDFSTLQISGPSADGIQHQFEMHLPPALTASQVPSWNQLHPHGPFEGIAMQRI